MIIKGLKKFMIKCKIQLENSINKHIATPHSLLNIVFRRKIIKICLHCPNIQSILKSKLKAHQNYPLFSNPTTLGNKNQGSHKEIGDNGTPNKN
jgi:hypothetical protein